jgi:hypothetical protein
LFGELLSNELLHHASNLVLMDSQPFGVCRGIVGGNRYTPGPKLSNDPCQVCWVVAYALIDNGRARGNFQSNSSSPFQPMGDPEFRTLILVQQADKTQPPLCLNTRNPIIANRKPSLSPVWQVANKGRTLPLESGEGRLCRCVLEGLILEGAVG